MELESRWLQDWTNHVVTLGQWLPGPSVNQEVGGAIPTQVDVSLSKTLNPELLLLYGCNMIVTLDKSVS